MGASLESSLDKRRTIAVFKVIEELLGKGKTTFRPGDVADVLRERNSPLGTWEIRSKFSRLEQKGVLVCHPATGEWSMVEGATVDNVKG